MCNWVSWTEHAGFTQIQGGEIILSMYLLEGSMLQRASDIQELKK